MKRLDTGIAITIFGIALAIYLRTLAPSLLFGDSAEFQTIAATLGMGHPTGYAVYILLAKLFTFLPAGDIAYRVNLLSAVSAAATGSLVYLILRKLGAWRIPVALSVFMLMLTGVFWKHAAIAEVYTTYAAWLAFILYAILAWKDSQQPRWLLLAGLAGGSSLGIHTSVALAGIAILLFLILCSCSRRGWVQAAVGSAVGIALFLLAFLWIDFIDSPAGYYNTVVRHALSVWGMTLADFDSPFERLIFLYFPPQFRGQFFAASGAMIQERLRAFFSSLSWNVLFALIGLLSLFIRQKKSPSRWQEALFLLVAFATYLAFAVTYNVYDFDVFFIPAILILAVAIGLGFSALAKWAAKIPRMPRFLPTLGVSALMLVNLWFSNPGALSSLESRLPPMLWSEEAQIFLYPETRQYAAEQVVSRLEDDAILFTDWDSAYDYYYVAHVLQGRTGMDFHETYPQEGVTQLADSTLAYIEANIDSRPIYFSERPAGLSTRYKILPAGSHLFQIRKK